MSSINMMGAYSGIDMSVIDQLVEAEKAKGVRFTNRKQNIETERNAWKDINTRLDSLFKNLESLQKTETFESRTVTSNVKESMSLNVTANENAATGTYRVRVDQLATASRLTGEKIKVDSIYNLFDFDGDKLIIQNGEEQKTTIDLTERDSYSLKDIENAINEKTEESGIQATIVDKRLVLTDTVNGKRNITVTGDAASSLGFTGNPEQLADGQQAKFTINGLDITSDSNKVDDVIEGLTFELTNIHEEGTSELITVASDTKKTTEAVKKFVEQYNSTMRFIEDQMDVGDPTLEDNSTGALTGDGTLMRLQSGLRSIMTASYVDGETGSFTNLEDLGIEIDRFGVATFDEAVFNEALEEDPSNVARFFYRQGTVQEPVEGGEEGETRPVLKRDGVSELLKNFIDTYISSTNGVITNKNETYDRMIKDIDQQIEIFNERVDRKRDRYIQQFTALDIAMMQAQSQLDYMYSQIGLDAQ